MKVDLVMNGGVVEKDSLATLMTACRQSRLYNDKVESAIAAMESTERSTIVDFLILAAAGGDKTQLLFEQIVWALGKWFDMHLCFNLDQPFSSDRGDDDPPPGGANQRLSLVRIDAMKARQRKVMLVKYMAAMKRANAGAIDDTAVIDAGRTRARAKRYYMAVGTPENVMGWTPPQAVCMFL